MIDKNYLKAISCFNIDEYQNNDKEIKTIQFKENDDLNYCRIIPCHYWTSSKEIAATIKNTPPVELNPNGSFPDFEIKTFQSINDDVYNKNSIIQRTFFYGKEWRRRQFNNPLSTWGDWGKWININDTIDYILNNESIHENLVKNWNRYMIIDKNLNKTWAGHITTIDKIIGEIKNGTIKIYRNKSI
jgi:hypothetical protein